MKLHTIDTITDKELFMYNLRNELPAFAPTTDIEVHRQFLIACEKRQALKGFRKYMYSGDGTLYAYQTWVRKSPTQFRYVSMTTIIMELA
jgi:hypothetical protein